MAARVAETEHRQLLLRFGSALVLAPAAVAAVYVGSAAFAALIAVAGALAVAEIECMATARRLPGPPGLMAIVVFAASVVAQLVGGIELGLMVAAAGLVCIFTTGLAQGRIPWRELGSFMIMAAAAGALLWLREESAFGRGAVLWLLAVVWATDSGAFAVGRLLRGPRLAPRISPNKTLSGALGGVAAGVGAGLLAAWLLTVTDELPAMPPALFLAAGAAVVSVAGQLGDLAESALKRRYGVKNSGAWIPGHGGLLDRVDSTLAASIVYALLMTAHG